MTTPTARQDRLRLGFFTYLDGSTDPAEAYRQALELFVAADELGLDTGWVAQHHFGHTGTLPSPFVFFASVAERAEHIGLGTAVITLPLEIPLRVAEDAAVLETLHPGRVQVGFGTGGAESAGEAFGRTGQDRRLALEDGFGFIRSALRGTLVAGEGTALYPAAPELADRLWVGTGSEGGVDHVAGAGGGLLLSRTAWGPDSARTAELQVPLIERYIAGSTAAGHAPRVGLSRSIYPAKDRATARADLAPGLLDFHATLPKGFVSAADDIDDIFAAHNIHYGHPDEIIASLSADPALALSTELIFQVQPGQPGFDNTLRALESVARDVASSLGWTPARARDEVSARG